MAGRLFGSAGMGNSAAPAIAGFKVQTSVYGLPVPIVYGQARVAANLIHFTDPKATPQLSQGSRSKLVKVDQQVTGYLYQAAIALALCEGPIVGIGKVWRDKDAADTFANYQSLYGWSLFLGSAAQAAWSYLTANHPSEAVPYQFTAYVAHPALDLPNDVLSNYGWEILGLLQYGSGIVDANPKDILTDVLTNADHGAAFPAAQLGDLTAYGQYCIAAGLFLSPVLNAQGALAEQLQALTEATNSAFVWSDGKLKVVPYADQPVTGNSVTYTPNVTPLYDLTDDDFLAAAGEDPVTLVRKKASECYNQILVEFEDRAKDYNPNVGEAKDQASIEASALRPAPALRLSAIKTASTARYIAQLRLQRELNVRNTYQFRLGLRYSLLEPMDLVTLTDPGLGLVLAPVRITMIEESETGDLLFTAEEFPAGVASASRYGAAGANGYSPANNTPPGATTASAIFEGPGPLAQSALEIWMAASGGPNWGGCDVHFSTDNVTYTKVGSITRKGTFGVLTAALPTAAASPPNDTTNTLAVNVGASGGVLAAGSAADLAAFVTLCLVEAEFLAYQGASLAGAGLYNLTTLARGLFGSPIPASHAIGASFVRCDAAILKLAYPQGVNGQVVYFKFPAFNPFGLALEDVALVSAVSHTIGKNTVTTGGAGIVNPPTALITSTTNNPTDEVLTLDGGLGSGAVGALAWSYKVGAAAAVTGSGGLPFNITVTRALYYPVKVVLTITQSDGQASKSSYSVHPIKPSQDPSTGKVDLGGGNILNNHLGSVARSGADATPGSAIVGKLRNDGHADSPMLQHDGVGLKTIAKGYQAGTAYHKDAVTFPTAYQSAPQVTFKGGASSQPASLWGTAAQVDATPATAVAAPGATAQYDDFAALNLTPSGFTLQARLRQPGVQTLRTNAMGGSMAAAGDTSGSATLANAPAGDNSYNAGFDISLSVAGLGAVSATAVIAFDTNDGSGWVERTSRSFSISGTTSASRTWTGQVLTAVVSGLTATSTARLRVKSLTDTPVGGSTLSVTPGNVTYNTSADQYANKTPANVIPVIWEATGVL